MGYRITGAGEEYLLRRRRALENAMRAALRSVMRAFVFHGSQHDLAVIPPLWYDRVESVLLPSVRATFTGGTLEVRRQVFDFVEDVETIPRVSSVFAEDFLRTARNRLNGVADELWNAAREQLVEGFQLGESTEQLATRVRSAAGLTEKRALVVARTEVVAAANAGALAQAELVGPGVKEWLAVCEGPPPGCTTRPAHQRASGQRRKFHEAFSVGGAALQFPGEPGGPPDEVIQCRCTMLLEFDEPDEPASLTAALGNQPTGAMVALVPRAEDAQRIALPQEGDVWSQPDELHCTLLFLGDAAQFSDEQRTAIVHAMAGMVDLDDDPANALPQVEADAFASAHFNPTGEDPCWVLLLSTPDSTELFTAQEMAFEHLTDAGIVPPDQHSPYYPHVTLRYSNDPGMAGDVAERCGPIVFDRLRVAFGADDVTDIPLPGSDEGIEPTDDEVALCNECDDEQLAASAEFDVSRMPPRLIAYWTKGEGAAKIKWGVPGDFKRCVHHLRKYVKVGTEGTCANLHHEALGVWPGREGGGKKGHGGKK